MQTVKQLGDRLAQGGHPLKPRTIQTALGELEAAGLAAGSEAMAEPLLVTRSHRRRRRWGSGHALTRAPLRVVLASASGD